MDGSFDHRARCGARHKAQQARAGHLRLHVSRKRRGIETGERAVGSEWRQAICVAREHQLSATASISPSGVDRRRRSPEISRSRATSTASVRSVGAVRRSVTMSHERSNSSRTPRNPSIVQSFVISCAASLPTRARLLVLSQSWARTGGISASLAPDAQGPGVSMVQHDESELRRLLRELSPYAADMLLIGGWVPTLYARYGPAGAWATRPSRTLELDVALPGAGIPAAERPLLVEVLRSAGLAPDPELPAASAGSAVCTGETTTRATIEFLMPQRRPYSAVTRPQSVIGQPGLTAVQLVCLELLWRATAWLEL